MLNVQKYLELHTLDDLTRDLGIVVTRHPTDPLAILNYSQYASPKLDPIVRECRGLVLDTRDNSLVARAFPRFFNWGEVREEMDQFDFCSFRCESKEDGSLIMVYHFDGRWRVNTRGSFAQDRMPFCEHTWEEGVFRAAGVRKIEELCWNLDPEHTYVFELCTSWNKVVRNYREPALFLIGMFDGEQECEWMTTDQCIRQMTRSDIKIPTRFELHSIDEIQSFLADLTREDKTFEGVVICDSGNHRWKIKSPAYLELHRMRGNGDNIWHPKYLIETHLANEAEEFLTYFPEAAERYREVANKVDEHFEQLLYLCRETTGIESQKEFAQTIAGKTLFTGVLFQLRKQYGIRLPIDGLGNIWRESGELIHKVLFK